MSDDQGTEPGSVPAEAKPPPRPRWVKVSAILAAVIVVLVVVLAIVGGHGPARHIPGGGDHTPMEHGP
jgi:hypothetical protein